MTRAGAAASRLVAAVLVLTGGGAGVRAEDEPGDGRSVFAPSPPASVQRPDEEPRLLDLDLTGREGDVFPRLDAAISFELQNDANVKSDDRQNEINDLTTSNDLFLALRATRELSIQAGFVVEDVKSPKPGEDRYFQDIGVYVETLGLLYQGGAWALFGGKYNPTFGVAWDLGPGIYGGDLASDYELTERVGFGGAGTLDLGDFGRHTLTGQAFYLDTSVLSNSWGTERGRTREHDGGVSNTETLESFSITLDGEVPHTLEGLRYQLGAERQRHGRTQTENERGLAAALYGEFELAEDIDLEPVVEWTRILNFEGERNTVTYLTAGAGLFVGPWNAALSYTGRFTRPSGEEENVYSDRLVQISAGYEFASGVAINAGYVFFTEENVRNNVVGILLSYDFDVRIR